MLYIVKCNVDKSYYMGNTSTTEQIHIVEADSEEQVRDKVTCYYSKKDSEYSVTYWVNFENINELIS